MDEGGSIKFSMINGAKPKYENNRMSRYHGA
jgi:hypothetical protein